MANKKFKDTKVGQFLAKAAPTVLDLVGDVFPPVETLANLVFKENPELVDSPIYQAAMERYHADLNFHLENTRNARSIYGESKDTTDLIGNKIMNWNLPLIFALVLINIACVRWLDSSILAVVSNVIGMVMQKLFEERSAVTNFFFGSSQGSKDKELNKIFNNK